MMPASTRTPTIIEPSVGDRPRKGSTVSDQRKKTGCDRASDEGRSAAGQRSPSQHGGCDAVEGERVDPIWALPIGERAITKNAGDRGRATAEQHERPHPNPVGPDAAALGRPLVEADRSHRQARARGVQPQVEQARADDDDDEGDRYRARACLENGHQVGADDPLGGRPQGERDPVEDAERRQGGDDRWDLDPPDQAGIDQTEAEPAREDRRRPRPGSRRDDASAPIRNEPITTPRLIIAPTDRSRYPTRSAWVWAIGCERPTASPGSGSGDVGPVDETVESRVRVPEQGHDQQHLQRHRHPQPDLDDLAPLVLVAGVADRLAESVPTPGVRPGVADGAISTVMTSAASFEWRLGHGDTQRGPAAFDMPGPANYGLDDANLVQFVSGYLFDDRASRHHQYPVTEPRELEGVARLDQERGASVGTGARAL